MSEGEKHTHTHPPGEPQDEPKESVLNWYNVIALVICWKHLMTNVFGVEKWRWSEAEKRENNNIIFLPYLISPCPLLLYDFKGRRVSKAASYLLRQENVILLHDIMSAGDEKEFELHVSFDSHFLAHSLCLLEVSDNF